MGVKSAWSLLKDLCPASCIPPDSIQIAIACDHIVLDCNPFLHRAVQGRHPSKDIVKTLHNKLARLQNAFVRNSVGFAFDGPSPLCKVLEQRKRRSAKRRPERVHFTPGTTFTNAMAGSLIEFVQETLLKRIRLQEVYLSHSLMPGEGEVKLNSRIQDVLDNLKPDEVHPVFLCCSSDADAAIQVIAAGLPHTFILTDNTPAYCFSGDIFFAHLRNIVPCDPAHFDSVRLDFCFLMLLSGNDYLPKLGRVGFKSTWNAYRRWRRGFYPTSRSIVQPGDPFTIDLGALYHVLSTRVRRSDDKGNAQDVEEEGEDEQEDEEDFVNEDVELHVNPTQQYLEGLMWVLEMYYQGRTRDYRYAYLYDRAPRINEILDWIQDVQSRGTQSFSVRFTQKSPLLPELCAITCNPATDVPDYIREVLVPVHVAFEAELARTSGNRHDALMTCLNQLVSVPSLWSSLSNPLTWNVSNPTPKTPITTEGPLELSNSITYVLNTAGLVPFCFPQRVRASSRPSSEGYRMTSTFRSAKGETYVVEDDRRVLDGQSGMRAWRADRGRVDRAIASGARMGFKALQLSEREQRFWGGQVPKKPVGGADGDAQAAVDGSATGGAGEDAGTKQESGSKGVRSGSSGGERLRGNQHGNSGNRGGHRRDRGAKRPRE
ncbi:hypothetical protein BJ742DRAFT_817383 [Cladochytrium replicatum]|nr:hypothetical protein BJ742DRAFT_817383 [Cladochytrium replicatum]